jgi:predicted Rossmann fold nucleotide-binding protein DprA/Smf involved in DNA uptake
VPILDKIAPPSPLTLSEYNSLASWLRQQELTPADLLDRSLQEKLPDITIARTGFWASFFPTQSGFFARINLRKMAKPRTMDYRTGEDIYPQRLKQKLKHLAPPII